MAIGDTTDIFNRLTSLYPRSWYSDGPTPVRDSAISGKAANLSWVYSLYSYVLLQARIATATGVNLDKIANDFLGTRLPREFTTNNLGVRTDETDTSYRSRILKEILRARNTRAGIIQSIIDLTGLTPMLVEPWNPNDTAAYGENAYYGIAGTYGSLLLRNQIFITAYRPIGQGIANIAGYGYGYYGAYTTAYVDISQMIGPVTDAEIYRSITNTLSAGIVAWTAIKAPPIILTTDIGTPLVSEVGLGPSRTNMLLQSDTFSNASWTKTNCSVTVGTANPFSTLSSDGWTWQRASTASAQLGQQVTHSLTPLAYTLSVYAAPGTGNFLALGLQDLGTGRADVVFNLSGGVISLSPLIAPPFTNVSATIRAAGNGWYRCTLTVTTWTTSPTLAAYISGSSNGVEIDGTDSVANTTIKIYGAQLEQSSVATNYIPTLATTITVTDSGVELTP